MNRKYMTNCALLVGPVVAIDDLRTGETLGVMPQNREAFLNLAKKYRIRRHQDGWFVSGSARRSQIWEYGSAKLGLTVTGSRFIKKCRAESAWLLPKSIGDGEANFWCVWTDDNLKNLSCLTGLQRRKAPIRPAAGKPFASTASVEGEKSHE